MAPSTHQGAGVRLQIAQWSNSLGLDDAIPQLFGDQFAPETAAAEHDPALRKVLMLGESIGTLTKHNLLSKELVHDWLWIEGLWSRVGPAALRQRERYGEPRLYENFEA